MPQEIHDNQADSSPTERSPDLWLQRGCWAVSFLIPLKLIFAYAVLIPLILRWGYLRYRSNSLLPNLTLRDDPASHRTATALFFFFSVLLLSSLFGLHPLHSVRPFLSVAFFALTLFVFANYGTPRLVIPPLLLGQSLASLHSIIDSALPETIPTMFIGKVTESGQLTLTLLLALGVAWSSNTPTANPPVAKLPRSALFALPIGICLIALGFQSEILSPPLSIACLLILTIFVVAALRFARPLKDFVRVSVREGFEPFSNPLLGRYLTCVFCLPLLLAALVVNLKRGPWGGIFVGTMVFLLYFKPRLIRPLIISVIGVVIFVSPVRNRLLDSYEHFTITGGRSTIWRIGAELTAKYPLGIGLHNSSILRKFAPEIPPELRHFHSNILNVVAENGWLGLAVFMWLMWLMIRLGFRHPRDPVTIAVGCGLLSWQIAGLGEYNFGDSEVLIIVWILVGMVMYQRRKCSQPSFVQG